jgi:RimK family alpha-L-glutamate ligase
MISTGAEQVDGQSPLPGSDPVGLLRAAGNGRPAAAPARIGIVGYPNHAMVSRLSLELLRRGREVTKIEPDAVVAVVRDSRVHVQPFCDEPAYDAVILTVSTDQVAALHALSELAEAGIRVANTAPAVLRAADKFATARLLTQVGLRVPRTVCVCTQNAALHQAELVGYPLVLKATDGSEGEQVALVADPDELCAEIVRIRSTLGMAATVNSTMILQEVVPGGAGKDRRLFVVGGRVQAAMDRVPRPGEWRSNMSQGASPVAAEPSADEIRIAEAAVAALGLDFGTVDLMDDDDGPVVIEANPFGDVLDVALACRVDLIGALADFVDMLAGVRVDTPIRPRPLSQQELANLSRFCWNRWQRKVESLPELDQTVLNAS